MRNGLMNFKMRIEYLFLIIGLSVLMGGQNDEKSIFQFSVTNKTDISRVDAPVIVTLKDIKTENMHLFNGNNEIPFQMDENKIVFVYDFSPRETKRFSIQLKSGGSTTFKSRVQAELSIKEGGYFKDNIYQGGTFKNVSYLDLPEEHTDHSTFIRYEGPGWESEKVGYRFYLDWRNAIDIYGKKQPAMILQNVGQDGFDSYHEMSDWGMDILKVGESLGLGSIGMAGKDGVTRVAKTNNISCEITENGPVRAVIKTVYNGWEVDDKTYDLESNLSIYAGSRITENTLTIDPDAENICTGLVKHPDAKIFKSSENKSQWSYFATYGVQSLSEDNLGMAIIYPTEKLLEIIDDKNSHIIKMKPEKGRLVYHFLAAWEGEDGGISNEDEFLAYLNDVIIKMNDPISIDH